MFTTRSKPLTAFKADSLWLLLAPCLGLSSVAHQKEVINPDFASAVFKSLHFVMSVAIIGKHTLNAGFHW